MYNLTTFSVSGFPLAKSLVRGGLVVHKQPKPGGCGHLSALFTYYLKQAGETAQPEECLSRKPGQRYPQHKLSTATRTGNPSAGKVETGGALGLADQPV